MSDDWKYYYEQLLPELRPINPLPIWPIEEPNWVKAPLHVMSIAAHACVFCGEAPTWESYQDYLRHFYEEEWEGERSHNPSDEEHFLLVASLCLAGLDESPDTDQAAP
ncbi:hypothetical protein HWC33_gp25 [Microbacterium phage TinyTimothy]|uniref:Uncharacterized protein n=1 Tax=Microbacterium phage TinyTimothy TaxID=2583039 RepID=A0A4Y6EE64_9CAUD|nr:hypothetical protein HWC33_gp25 [Microbacterium phage TinyTimothy]QDF16978.1 hypothetical protein SEA_TINYTIMOTHY_25 [Microbacterium phage TinyTimothy]